MNDIYTAIDDLPLVYGFALRPNATFLGMLIREPINIMLVTKEGTMAIQWKALNQKYFGSFANNCKHANTFSDDSQSYNMVMVWMAVVVIAVMLIPQIIKSAFLNKIKIKAERVSVSVVQRYQRRKSKMSKQENRISAEFNELNNQDTTDNPKNNIDVLQ